MFLFCILIGNDIMVDLMGHSLSYSSSYLFPWYFSTSYFFFFVLLFIFYFSFYSCLLQLLMFLVKLAVCRFRYCNRAHLLFPWGRLPRHPRGVQASQDPGNTVSFGEMFIYINLVLKVKYKHVCVMHVVISIHWAQLSYSLLKGVWALTQVDSNPFCYRMNWQIIYILFWCPSINCYYLYLITKKRGCTKRYCSELTRCWVTCHFQAMMMMYSLVFLGYSFPCM